MTRRVDDELSTLRAGRWSSAARVRGLPSAISLFNSRNRQDTCSFRFLQTAAPAFPRGGPLSFWFLT